MKTNSDVGLKFEAMLFILVQIPHFICPDMKVSLFGF